MGGRDGRRRAVHYMVGRTLCEDGVLVIRIAFSQVKGHALSRLRHEMQHAHSPKVGKRRPAGSRINRSERFIDSGSRRAFQLLEERDLNAGRSFQPRVERAPRCFGWRCDELGSGIHQLVGR